MQLPAQGRGSAGHALLPAALRGSRAGAAGQPHHPDARQSRAAARLRRPRSATRPPMRNYEIIIVDNGSVEPETLAYFDELRESDNVRVLRYDKPFNYSAINNFAVVEGATATIIGLVNNDIEVISPDWLTEMVSWAVQPDIGCVGAKLYYRQRHHPACRHHPRHRRRGWPFAQISPARPARLFLPA